MDVIHEWSHYDSFASSSDGTTTTRFDQTPPMSTYLNAFIVSDFVFLESNQGRVPHRVFARSNAINQSALILDAGVKILDALGTYLGVEYSLPKMDQVAVPDFGPGAMENWGLVTYRESRFFYDDAVTDYILKSSIITTIAHEVYRVKFFLVQLFIDGQISARSSMVWQFDWS